MYPRGANSPRILARGYGPALAVLRPSLGASPSIFSHIPLVVR